MIPDIEHILSMVKFIIKRIVSYPISKVFTVFTQFDQLPQRIPGITNIEVLSEEEVQEGYKFKETRIISGHSASEEFLVESFQSPEYFSLAVNSCGVKYTYTYKFEKLEKSSTKLWLIVSIWPSTFFAWLFYPFMWWFSSHFVYETERDVDTLLVSIGEK
eukprot:TRINITY_DN2271_c1_g1_i5.p1 TRINITY_DN2271_c1_g1~~TRINITY_DN2271_c1_g1_i5.p1  ORF type:complete len:160 (+),score=8.82 TRINITY_DN2271_c1_g1_i5:51-530(+)